MSTEIGNQGLRIAHGQQLSAYIADASERQFPPAIVKEARRALVDFPGLGVGAANGAPIRPVRSVVEA